MAWTIDSKKNHQIGRARRLEVVRTLARYCVSFEPETEIPQSHLLGPAHRRPTPYIYSDQEVTLLLDMATDTRPKQGLRPMTMHYLLGLLAATGLRISEALQLNRDDVDLHQTVVFTGIIILEKMNVFNYRSLSGPISKTTGFFSNKWVLFAVVITIGLQVCAVYLPFLQRALHTTALGWREWALILAVAAPIYLLTESVKWIRWKIKEQ